MSKFIVCLLLFSSSVSAQWIQLGQTLDGDNLDDNLGLSVSMSHDGTIIAMGAYENDNLGNNIGQVKVYSLQNCVWVQMGNSIYGENTGDKSGESISMNASGTRLAIGARFNGDGGLFSGHVRVYDFNGVDWVQIGSDIDGDIQSDAFGRRVALSSDGSRLAIGIPFRDDNGNGSGQIRVYEFNGTDWIQIGNVMSGSNPSDKFGWDISISNDGNTVASGGWDSGINGYARVYFYNGTNWVQKGQDIVGENITDLFGEYIELSSSGNLLGVSGRHNDDAGTDTGYVKLYKFENNLWSQLGSDINGDTEYEYLGQHIDFSDNETLLGVSSWESLQGRGKIYFYEIQGNTITNTNTDIIGEFTGDFLGWSFEFNQLGDRILVGRPGAEPNAGKVTVFKKGLETSISFTDASACGILDGSITISDFSPNTDYTITYNYQGTSTNLNLQSNASGSILITSLPSGSYDNIMVTEDATGCEDDLGQVVIDEPDFILSFTKTDPSSCSMQDGEILISDLVPNQSYVVDYFLNSMLVQDTYTADSNGEILLTGLSSGQYENIMVVDTVLPCTDGIGLIELEASQLGASISFTDSNICGISDGNITISDISPNTDYTITYNYQGTSTNLNLQSDVNGNIVITNLSSGSYDNIMVTEDATGCEDDLGQVFIDCVQTISEECFRVKKFFTPNSDGFNDFWHLEMINECSYLLYIYDRYGKQLTALSPSNPYWNGIYNGANMPTNDYWFFVNYITIDGVHKSYSSYFTLKR